MASEHLTGFRLSPQQEHLWRVWQDGGGTYQAECVVRLAGAVDAAALSLALDDVVLRHEVLRTVLRPVPGLALPLQVVLDAAEPLAPFDGDGRSPLRARLVPDAPGSADDLRLLLELPAVCADSIGLENLVREIALAYAARRGTPVERDEPIQYVDVSEIFHDFLAEEDPTGDRSWWRELDLSAPPLPFLPPVQSAGAPFRPERVRCAVPLSTTAGLGAPEDDPAPWLAAWQVLLWRLSDRQPILVGVAVDGRTYEGLDEALGLFARHLPVRSLPEAGLPFRAFADRVREDLRAAAGHQELFTWENAGGTVFPPCAFEVEPRLGVHRSGEIELAVEQRSAVWDRFALKLSLVSSMHGLTAELCFDAATVRREDVERLAERFLALTAAASAHPEAPLDDLDLVGPWERGLLLALSAAPVDLGPARTLAELWREQVHAGPHATAAVFRDLSLSRGELADRADRLARRLRALGVGPEVRVGLAVERSLDLVVGLLAILEAGGAWVSLDPSYPRDRLVFMLEDCGARVLLTQERLRGILPSPAGGVLYIDEEGDEEAGAPAGPQDAKPEHLAYVLYTSGSTGRPKGVMVTHRAIVNRLLWMQRTFPLAPDDAVLQKTPYGFDASIWEIFLPLFTGARLVVAEPEGHRDAAYLATAVVDRQITVLQLVPSLLGPFLEQEGIEAACRALRRLFCGGEALPGKLVERFFARGGTALCNLYGPTEAAIDATFHSRVSGDGEGPAAGTVAIGIPISVPIGRPIANDEIYLLDSFRLVPWGVPGEIHIGGTGLARGYAGRPELTAERFLPHPWSAEPGARLYRTGDLARFRSDNALEFLGRADQQVKIRGVRIEPGEVEATLTRHPAVREAAVTVREEPSGQRRLVAYVVPAREAAKAGDDLYRLPNGLEVACLNRNEADLIYQEIFVDETYLAHGIALGDGACVFDVGANIGLFTLFLSGRFHDLRLFAFEPIPPTFEVLRANVDLYGLDAMLFPCGIAERSGEAEFTFYPRWSAMSGAHADQMEEEAVSRVALANQDRRLEEHSDDLLAARFAEKRVYTCRLRTLSEVIRETGVERIDLLKVDAEKSEENVLSGLLDQDWERIAQLVVEVHDVGGRLDRVRALLAEHGFEVVVDQDAPLRGTTIYNLYARHPERVRPATGGERPRPDLRGVLRPVLRLEELGAFLAERLPEPMVPAVFVPVERLPRLPNGKLDRAALPAPESVSPPEDSFVAPRTPTEERLAAIWAEVLGLAESGRRIGIHDNFFRFGGDSIQSILVVSRAARAGLHLTARQLFENQTIASLAAVVDAAGGAAEAVEDGPVSGEVPLTPAQRAFFSAALPHPEHFNQAVLLAVEPPAPGRRAGGASLRGAVELLIRHHDALRMRFEPPTPESPAVRQVTDPPGVAPLPCAEVDLSALPAARRSAALEVAAAATQGSLDLTTGPLLRAVHFHLAAGEADRLLLVIHHLVVDGVSWRILLEDLEIAWRGLAGGGGVELPQRTTSFQRWAERLTAYARSATVQAERDGWQALLDRAPASLPVDTTAGPNDVASLRSVTVALDPEETRALLQEVPRVYRTQINDVLLTALAEAMASWTGSRRLLLELEGHGREDVFPDLDLSRTVGWFTTAFPVLLELPEGTDPGAALKAVKEQLRSLPGSGLGYGLLRHLPAADGGVPPLGAAPAPEVVFNYLGQLDQTAAAGRLFPAAESAGTTRHPRQPRPALLEITAAVAKGRLQATWLYSSNRHDPGTVERLAAGFTAALRRLVEHCQTPDAGGFTPSDFPLARVDQTILDRLAATAMGTAGIEDLYPATPTQQGLLFHTLRSPGSGVYLGQLSLALGPELNAAAFERAWQQVVDRHVALRTAFFGFDLERLLQVVQVRAWLPWARYDWGDLPPAERSRRLVALLEEDRRRDFDLAMPPLARVALIHLGAEGYRFVWTHHHAILDGWSMPILLRDLFAFYEAAVAGREAKLEPAPAYRTYVAWLEGRDPAAAESVWRRALSGVTTPTPLPGQAEEGGGGAGDSAQRRLALSATVTDALRSLARDHGLTLNTLLQGAWALLLHRASGGWDGESVVFGSVTAGRSAPVPGIEEMVGLFINTLPVRVAVDAAARLTDWLRDLQERQAEVRQFEDSPLLQVQGWSEVPRGRPLFESVLAFENYPINQSVRERAGLGLRITDVAVREQTSYPLTLSTEPGPVLHLRLSHDARRIPGPAAARLLRHLAALLAAMAADPGAALASLPVLTEEEQHQILWEWNDTGKECPQVPLVHELFAAHAARHPDAPAISSPTGGLTYGEVEARANRLAHHLRSLGVGPDVLVAMCTDRTPERVVGIVGVLKAGGAYVTLDPTHPRERLAFLLEDARAPVLLTQQAFLEVLPQTGARVLCLDTDEASEWGDASRPPESGVTPDNLSYVVYTSGSTGKPKGIEIPHAGLMNLVRWHQDLYQVRPEDRGTQIASPAFDASIWELWPYLAAGASVHVPDEETRLSAAGMIRWWASQNITLAYLMTPLAEGVLAETIPAGLELETRALIIGGDRLHRGPSPGVGFRLMNHYGPAEYSVTCTVVEVPPEGERKGIPTIGRPIDNTRIHVLDRTLAPVPIGTLGELFITGVGLARGYLGRPDLTAEKFVPDPFAGPGEPGARIYRTGDLVRYLPDGDIDFQGRLDHQVKLRGLRIELGEIEGLLGQHPAAREAIVLVREDRPGDRRLVAYVVPADEPPAAPPTIDELRGFLAESLPEYMVPAAFILLPALPLTPNGKVDRRALPAPEWQSAGPAGALKGPYEELLAGLFVNLLGLEAVGGDDDFFALGGHSLLATRLVSGLRATFGVEIPLAAVFETSTVRGLAERVDQALRGEDRGSVSHITPRPRSAEAPPLSFAQQRLWFIDQLEPGSPLYNIAVALRVEGPLDSGVLALCLGEIVRRHETLRTVFATAEGVPVQVIRPAFPFDLTVVDLSGLPEGRREERALALAGEEAGRPFDLARGPLLRGLLLRLAGDDHVAALTLHHIVSDGWSMGILVREVAALYAALTEGRPSPLPELPVQYADFAVWQRAWLNRERLESEISFWRRQLAGLPPRLELPTDRPRPAMQSFRGATRSVRLPAGLTRQVQSLSRDEGATLFMVLLAAFQALLARYSQQQDLAVGSPIAGRNRAEVEGLIGFFVNTLVLRGDLTGDRPGGPSFLELLGRARGTALAAYTHQDVPFEKLVEELAPVRSLAHAPLFQVTLVFQNAPAEALEIQSLRLRPAGIAGATAKFDLTLSLGELNGELHGGITYATDLFDAVTIDRLTGHFERLLAGAVESPGRPLSELSLLTPAEHNQVVEWNDTTRHFGEPSCVHHLIADWVARAPEAEAVVCAGRSLTFGDLGRRAAGLALHLREQGVGPEVPVAFFLERSVEAVVALVGVLAAGGAYVPVDPTYPPDWVAWVLKDSRAPVVITTSSLAGRLPADTPTVLLEEVAESAATFDSAAGPDHPAYLIYTSGSTGRPKGVVVRHGSLMNLTRALREKVYPGEAGPLRVSVNASFAFDGSVKQIVQLAWGHCLHVLPQDVRLDPDAMVETVRRQRLDVLDCTPSQLRPLLQAGLGEGDAAPAMVLVGGEAVDAELRDFALTRTRTRFWNLYGPTECTVDTVATPFAAGTPPSRIGPPLPNVRVYVSAGTGDLAPVGVPGELQVGGAGLARGYLGRPDLTAERFIPDPFGGGAGERLYRTGDLVRWLPDGSLDFLSRLDHQVKIRGFRIELGEIEAVLAALPAVQEALVVTREDRPGARRLVAYVVSEAAPETLRQGLRERLPEHMVPAAFVTLAQLPLTPNGKVDREALPAPEQERAEESWLEPRTPVEEVLAAIWAELLGLERVGAADSFFDLGGHSLLATRVMSRLRSAFGIEMPLRDLFEAPVLADLATRVEGALRAGTGHLTPSLVPISPELRQGPLPLSFAQQRLWFIDQLEPGSPLYNMPVMLRAEGPLDAAALASCLGEIVRRHEALRTVFTTLDDSPVQTVRPAAPFVLPVVDLSGLPEGEREARALALAAEEAALSFDLTRGPLLRGVLLRLAGDDHIAALTMHHIASDGWSMGILVRETSALYAAFSDGRPSLLPELPLQYADFSVWQRSWLHGAILESEITFWRRQLAGLPPRLELPTDHPRPAVQSFRGALRPVRLPADLTRQVQALSRREGATLFMGLLAAFQSLLARYSGQQDLAVGSPVAGRNRLEIEGLIGFFVNTLVLRGDLTGDPSFRTLLGRVREAALAAHMHQDVPFEKLVEELAPERSLAQTPLFQVLFVLQNVPVQSLEARDLRLRPVSGTGITSKFDLTLNLREFNGGLIGVVEHATDLFDTATVDRLIGHFERLLAAAVATPELPAQELPLLGRAEREQVLIEWNDTRAVAASPARVHDLFDEQARRTPDAVAVVFGDETLTYAGLAARAGSLARRLRRLGVGPDVLVGLLVERSLDMIVGTLGILQAGGAYVPLDPRYPEKRLAFMLDDTRSPVLLTQSHLRDRLPVGGSEVLLLDTGDAMADEDGGVAITAEASPESLAYVIYTSGSTGRPKGVSLPHAALRNLIDWHLATLLGGAQTLQFASLSFDASFHEMFACWGSGGTLVVVPEELRRDMPALAGLLVEQRIEKAILPVVVLQQLAELFADREDLPPLREITTTGERLQTNRPMAALLRRLPGCAFHNHYGPSETHVATASTLSPDPEAWAVYPSIGRPIWNSTTYVLEPGLAPAPVGVPGDLFIGGTCVARGYLGRPDLTAERFVPDPFGSEPGGRLYRTGDKVRTATNGDLEYLGRFDDQIKIRGFRIEPGEIEEALLALAGVREAVVVPREDRPGDRRLVAYVVGDVAPDALRQLLRERLPDHMVPGAFVTLAALPLTPNGKVDRRALPAPEWPRPEESYLAPRTPVEEVLAGIWAELLGVERVGAADHFFDLGGHSLLATRVMSRLRSAFGIELPLRELFDAPRLADLAARVETVLRAGTDRRTPPLVPIPLARRQGPLPLSFAQQRLWFIDQLAPGSPLYNMPVALRVAGPLDADVLALCLGEIVRRHEALRTVFAAPEGSPVQWVQPAAPFPLPIVDLSGLPEGAREAQALALAAAEAGRPFDLTRGPLLRGLLLRLAGEDHVAALTMHHIVSDGWSVGILVREVTALYAAFAEDRPSPLPEPPVQYADFAAWQHSWLHGEVLEDEISFWRRQLAGLPSRLELPTDRPRPPVQSFRGAARPLRLPVELTRQVLALSRSQGATPFMVLLAGFQALLARYSGQEDLAVGTPIAGRNRIEVEGLIGFFVNTLVLRGDLTRDRAGGPSFRALLGRVRETALAAHTHQEVPFERLVQELSPERSLAHTPLFQVMLVLQNTPVEKLEIPNLSVRPVGAERTTAKFDLTFGLREWNGQLIGAVEYVTELFDAATVDRLAGHFERLLAAAVATPDLSATALPLLSLAESGQILREWNDTRVEGLAEGCLHDDVAAQAARTPSAVAVESGAERWTYRRLVGSARLLASHLRDLGVGPETIVGLCAERSPAMVMGILAVLDAGGAYLPLDPAYPAERLAFMLEDSGAGVLLIQDHLLERVPAAGRHVVPLDERWDSDEEREALGVEVTPDHLAYVIYTSGSTGRPKGVMVPHRGVRNRLRWAQEVYRLDERDAVLQKASFSFDFSVWECFAPLSVGARLVLAEPGRQGDGPYLARVLCEQRVTFVHFVPSLLAVFLDEEDGGEFVSLRQVFVGGEALTPELRDRALARLSVPLDNQYGPTEISIDTTRWICAPGQEPYRSLIGRPIGNSRLYVVDPELRPTPIGVAGELLVGGVGVTRGYLRRPDLTAERFVPDPFDGSGGRLYRTGDLVRWLPDGTLEFLGRLDHQVKVRGFRIELEEIEAALATLAGVREAIVVAREDTPGDRRLVAYVAGDVTEVAADELRRSLRERLPDYMVPAAFVVLAALPLTPNGKVDRKALARLEPERHATSRVPPRDLTELRIARLFEELLAVEPVGAGDDFFELGGHSLLAVRLLARLRRELGRDLPLSTLFRGSTVERLAAAVRSGEVEGSPLVALRTAGALPPLFLVHPVGGNVLCYAELARRLDPGRPVYGLQSMAASNGHAPTLESMAASYLAEIRKIQPHGPYSLGGWSMGGAVAFEMARQLSLAGEMVAPLVLIDAFAPRAGGDPQPLAATDLLALFGRDLAGLAGRSLSLPDTLPEESAESLLRRVHESGLAAGLFPPDLGADDIVRLFAVFRANLEAMSGYRGGSYDGPLLLLRAGEGVSGAAADLGWGRLATGPLEIVDLTGDHYSILRSPAVDELSRRITAVFDTQS